MPSALRKKNSIRPINNPRRRFGAYRTWHFLARNFKESAGPLLFLTVKTLMDLSELLVRDVGVDLGRGDRRVAEHGLDRADIGAVAEQIGGERVPERMGRDLFADNARFDGVFMDDSLDAPRRQPQVGVLIEFSAPGNADEKGLISVRSLSQIVLYFLFGVIRKKDQPYLAALAHDRQLSAFGINFVSVQRT